METNEIAQPLAMEQEHVAEGAFSNENGASSATSTPPPNTPSEQPTNDVSGIKNGEARAELPKFAATKDGNTPEKVLISIQTRDRKKIKAFMSMPSIQHVIEKAKMYGLDGSTIVLAKNGCEICEDEALALLAQQREIFMLLAENEEYVPVLNEEPSDLGDSSSLATANESLQSNEETRSAASPRLTNSSGLGQLNRNNTAITVNADEVEIDWTKLPMDMARAFHMKQPVGRRLQAFCDFLWSQLKAQHAVVTETEIRKVAQLAGARYPDSLLPKSFDLSQKSRVPPAVVKKMLALIHKPSMKRPRDRTSSLSSTSSKRSKLSNSFANGNGNGDDNDNGKANKKKANPMEENNSLESKRLMLVQYHQDGMPADQPVIAKFMKECYHAQHFYFNHGNPFPDMLSVKQNWPYIFNKELLYQYFEQLKSQDPRKFIRKFHAEKARILKFLKSLKDGRITALGDTDDNVVRSVAYYFNEDPNAIFQCFPHNTKQEELVFPVKGPWAAFTQHENFTKHDDGKVFIYIESKLVAEYKGFQDCFVETLTQLLCYYYTFDMRYPDKAMQTYQFFESYLLPTASPEKIKQSRRKQAPRTKMQLLVDALRYVDS